MKTTDLESVRGVWMVVPEKLQAEKVRDAQRGNLREYWIAQLSALSAGSTLTGGKAIYRRTNMWEIVLTNDWWSPGEWLADQSSHALIVLKDHVELLPGKLGGTPVLKGTRFSITQLLAELADSDAVGQIADDFDLDAESIRTFLHSWAVFLDRPAT